MVKAINNKQNLLSLLDTDSKNQVSSFLKNKIQLIIFFLGFFLSLIGVFIFFVAFSQKEKTEIEILTDQEESADKFIFIHLSGAVQKPGLYKLASDSRVNDALVLAGGLAEKADRIWFEKNINLAQKLTDGIKIYIPFKGETDSFKQTGSSLGSSSTFQGKINLNTASLSELDSLPGIGPVYAQRIIDARPFAKIEDILKVQGIGQSTFEKIKDLVVVY